MITVRFRRDPLNDFSHFLFNYFRSFNFRFKLSLVVEKTLKGESREKFRSGNKFFFVSLNLEERGRRKVWGVNNHVRFTNK